MISAVIELMSYKPQTPKITEDFILMCEGLAAVHYSAETHPRVNTAHMD